MAAGGCAELCTRLSRAGSRFCNRARDMPPIRFHISAVVVALCPWFLPSYSTADILGSKHPVPFSQTSTPGHAIIYRHRTFASDAHILFCHFSRKTRLHKAVVLHKIYQCDIPSQSSRSFEYFPIGVRKVTSTFITTLRWRLPGDDLELAFFIKSQLPFHGHHGSCSGDHRP